MNLHQLLLTLLARKRIIIATILVTVCLTFAVSLVLPNPP